MYRIMKIAIIGGGNMGGAMARGFATGSVVRPEDITVADRSEQTLLLITAYHPGIAVTTANRDAVGGADLIILAVKPWLLEEVIADLKPALDYSRQAVGSVVAGVAFEALGAMLDKGDGLLPALYRIIPNTAISIGESVTFIAASGAAPEQRELVMNMFGELGSVFAVEEGMMAAGTSLASCGIAFALQYMNASIEGGVELGFGQEEARAIVMQTVRGALEMMKRNGTMPRTEIDKVTTPGGITLKGLKAMADAGFTEAVLEGLKQSR